MLIRLPLVENVISFRRVTNGIQHVAVALAVDTLLEGLNGKAKVYLICRNILGNVGQVCGLQRIQIHQKAQDFIIGSSFRLGKLGLITLVLI